MTIEQRLAALEKEVAEMKAAVQPEQIAERLAARIQGALAGMFQGGSRTKPNISMNIAKDAPPPPPRTRKVMFIKPDMAQGHLSKVLQEIPCRGLEELFSMPLGKAPLPGDVVCAPDRNKPLVLNKYVVVRREFSPYDGNGIWNIRILVRPLTEEEEKQMNCELFGIEKWPETEEEARAFEEKFLPKAKSLD